MNVDSFVLVACVVNVDRCTYRVDCVMNLDSFLLVACVMNV